MMRLLTIYTTALLFLMAPVFAADEDNVTQQEIDYLLTEVAESGCLFIRNGDEHPADEAESHLRMKYGNGKRWVSSAEDFISRIATKSSWSGKIYQIQCPGEAARPSGDWLTEKLTAYRAQ